MGGGGSRWAAYLLQFQSLTLNWGGIKDPLKNLSNCAIFLQIKQLTFYRGGINNPPRKYRSGIIDQVCYEYAP